MSDPAEAPAPGGVRVEDWHIERRRLDHPDSLRLVTAVQQEYVLLYGGPDRSPMDPDHFEPPSGGFLVGYLAGEPVATAGWRRIERVAGQPPAAVPAELKRMFVLPAHRGRGLSRRMLAAVEQDAAAHGTSHLVLETGSRQPAAIALYRSSGYTDVDGTGWAEYHREPGAVILGRPLTAGPVAGDGRTQPPR